MIVSRTRKQMKITANFYKEAGIDNEIQNILQKNSNSDNFNKKDRLNQKKKTKNQNTLKLQTKIISDKAQTDISEQNLKQSTTHCHTINTLSRSNTESTLPLQKMLNKISILQITDSKIVNGCYGHSTVIFKRPIIQGQYYLEIKMLKANLSQGKAKIKCPPSIRLGICTPDYPKNSPLGQDKSIGYKGSRGKIICNGIQGNNEHDDSGQNNENIRQGDVMGLCMSFSPPDKYQDKQQLWEQSYVMITKNGKKVAKSSKIHQCFYCPAFSLFNYASVEVRYDYNTFQHLPPGFVPYSSIFNEPINYEPLKNTTTFAHLKLQQSENK